MVFFLAIAYPATSLKFIAYPPCAQSRQSLMHPEPKSPVLLLQSCNKLPQLFKLHPDGVIQHLASGMCFQSSRTDDPMKIAEGESLVLNYPCTLYRSEYNTLHALQFKLTTKGSLMEIRSGKCIYTRDGVENLPLTFTEICDTRNTQIAFVGNDTLHNLFQTRWECCKKPPNPDCNQGGALDVLEKVLNKTLDCQV